MTDYATQKWIRNRLARDSKRREYLGNVATFVLVTTALVIIVAAGVVGVIALMGGK